jgi:peptidoglycan/xylan/chitin deacetylase (PgdA/CDA1 family)
MNTPSPRVPILTYHALDESGSVVAMSPALFRAQMEFLRANGWRALSLDELLAGHARGAWDARTVALTFDDGFVNFFEHAFPVLRECQFTATVFVIADWVGKTNDWQSQLAWVPRHPLMNWRELRTIADAGIAIGAHTLSHPHLARLAAPDATREIVECKRVIADQIGREAQAFAYPYGEMSRDAEAIVAQHYRAGFSTQLGFATAQNRASAFARIDTYYLHQPRFFRALASGWLDWYLRARRWARKLRWGKSG